VLSVPSFAQAVLVIFQLLTADDWPIVMQCASHDLHVCIQVHAALGDGLQPHLACPLRHSSLHADAFDGTKGSYLSVVFFVLVTMLGMYIVLSLFVSILLERFGDQDAHKFEMEEQGEQVTAAPSTLFCFSRARLRS
jgi:hypothetical protein